MPKVISCIQCGQQFSNETAAKKHVTRSHIPSKPCTLCGKGFTRKDNLVRHLQMHHGKQERQAVMDNIRSRDAVATYRVQDSRNYLQKLVDINVHYRDFYIAGNAFESNFTGPNYYSGTVSSFGNEAGGGGYFDSLSTFMEPRSSQMPPFGQDPAFNGMGFASSKGSAASANTNAGFPGGFPAEVGFQQSGFSGASFPGGNISGLSGNGFDFDGNLS